MHVPDAGHRAALALVGTAAEAGSPGDFRRRTLPAVRDLIGADEVSFSEFRRDDDWRLHGASGFPTSPGRVPHALQTLRRQPAEHPVMKGWILLGRTGTVRLSDLHPRRDLDRLPFYREFFRPRGLVHADYVVLEQTPRRVVALGLGRSSHDFAAADHELLEHLRRPLAGVWRLVARAELTRQALGGSAPSPGADGLTEAERRVVALVTTGLGNAAVAERLGVSVKAVEQHLTRVYRKLAVRSRTQLVVATIQSRAEGSEGSEPQPRAGVFPIAPGDHPS